MKPLAIATLLFLALACHAPLPEGADPVVFDIGAVHREVTTSSPDAQLWFDRGLALAFGFNHEEAIRCFERATAADPDCAMAHWGKAWASGPNYNSPALTEEQSEQAFDALQEAVVDAVNASPVERDLVTALRARYAWPAPADRSPLDAEYAEAMREVYAVYPDDPDVAALYAEALMQLRPWKLWSPEGEPAPELEAIRDVLESGLARWPDHPALCHLYIHAMEAGPEVAKAIPAARRLEGLTPGLGHLVHMPSHIYVWTGNYDDVVRTNLAAVEIDDAFVDYAGRDNIYTAYRIHNYHFVAYGAMWQGRRALALEYSRRLVDEIPAGLIAAIPDLFDVFTATPYHVLVRFGLWDEILEEPEPEGELHAARAVWRYARGVALASLGRVDEALAEQERFLAAKAAVPASRLLFQNAVGDVLAVAEKVLAGEIEYRRGNHDRAFALLREAVVLDEQLNYDEPWGWMEPVRHALGALLTAQGRYEEAVGVYRANLERYPNNGWALHGLAECLRGLGRVAEADEVDARFAEAWERADVEIPGSCYCRVGA
jgi:tetratricopeptide (TPR) repeat protein